MIGYNIGLIFMITDAVYARSGASIENRVDDLVARMTIREKIAQLTGFWVPAPAALIATGDLFSPEFYRKKFPDGIGSIGPSNISLSHDIRYRNAVQKFLREQTRLGIPAIFHDEGAHGLMKPGSTSFPSPLGLASSWDAPLVNEIFQVVARQMRTRGAQHALTPVIDVARDPRWGRIDETFGEDPFLNARLGEQAVVGLQGGRSGEVDDQHVMATLKHFTGHGTPEGGLNCSPSLGGMRELREVHMAPFLHILKTARPAAVMPSYNEIDGIPAHGSVWLLKKVLREEWNFDGLIVGDYFGVQRLHVGHDVAPTKADAARLAFEAGVQLELPEAYAFPDLEECVVQGKVALADLDGAVSLILSWKFRLGLFENPYVEERLAVDAVRDPFAAALARRAAEESVVLLKNEGNVLPLNLDTLKTLAVIGPNAAVTRLGGYSGDPLKAISLLEGIRDRVGDRATVLHAPGCTLVKNDPVSAYDRWKFEEVELASDAENAESIAEAVALVARADVVILAVGETESLCREAYSDKVVGDATSLDFPGSQPLLIDRILALGKPVILYLMNGRPLALARYVPRAAAIIEGWYMGESTGVAAAKILFGDISPSGKLTVSFPKSIGHLPCYYSKKPFAARFPYIFSDNQALYPFGFGLSYTTFEYSDASVNKSAIGVGESASVSVWVKNTGNRNADEIVQMYLHARVEAVTRPVRELKGFTRIKLQAGESRKVAFEITRESLSIWNLNMEFKAEPGIFEIYLGGSSAATAKVSLEAR